MTSTPPSLTSMMPNRTCVNAMDFVIEPEDCDFVTNVSLVFIVVSVILIVFGLLTNIVLLIILTTNGRVMKTRPNIYIANMALLGIIFLVVVCGGNLVVFGQVAFQVQVIESAKVSDNFFLVQLYVSVASFSTLVALGIDRYISIVHPLRSKAYRTKKQAFFTCGLVWIVSGVCMIPVVLGDGRSNIFRVDIEPSFITSFAVFFALAFILPMLVIACCYVAILKTVWCNPANVHVGGEEQARRHKQRLQILKTITIIILSFVVHYGYFFAVALWGITGAHVGQSYRLKHSLLCSAILVAYLNVCVNPMIYALHQKGFRPYVYKLLCPWRYKHGRGRHPKEDALNTTTQLDANTQPGRANRDLDPDDLFVAKQPTNSADVSIGLAQHDENEDSKHPYMNGGYLEETDRGSSQVEITMTDSLPDVTSQHTSNKSGDTELKIVT